MPQGSERALDFLLQFADAEIPLYLRILKTVIDFYFSFRYDS